MGRPPKGYVKGEDEEEQYLIVPGPEADDVREAFDLIATGAFNQAEVLRLWDQKGLSYGSSRFSDMLRNPIYVAKQRRGKNACFSPEDDPMELIPCVHQPLVTEDVFYRVQEILDGPRGRRNKWRWSVPPELPLRGHLVCRQCGHDLTGSGSTSHTGKKHYYYHCQKQLGCSERFRAPEANERFEDLLADIEVPSGVIELYEEILDDVWRKRRGIQQSVARKVGDEIGRLESKLEKLEERYYIDGDMPQETFDRLSGGINSQLQSAKLKKDQPPEDLSNRKNFIVDGMRLLAEVSGYYRDSSVTTKQRIVSTLFPGKVIFDEGVYRTQEIHPAIEILALDINQLQEENKKSPEKTPGLERMVSPAGFEPASSA